MVVQHNMQAMNASRMLGITTGSQSKATEKLSSGYRINRAADDAAGLTISEKMRKQIRGLDRASTNAQDGVSAVQTAEGALTEVHSMLQRMNELATQAANGTNSESDRDAIQAEIDQLTTEIDRVAETTKFNETYLLKGNTAGTSSETKVAAHDAGIAGKLTDNGDTATFKIDKALEDGDKVTIAGKEYTIGQSASAPAEKYSDAATVKALTGVAAGDSLTDSETGKTYTVVDKIAAPTTYTTGDKIKIGDIEYAVDSATNLSAASPTLSSADAVKLVEEALADGKEVKMTFDKAANKAVDYTIVSSLDEGEISSKGLTDVTSLETAIKAIDTNFAVSEGDKVTLAGETTTVTDKADIATASSIKDAIRGLNEGDTVTVGTTAYTVGKETSLDGATFTPEDIIEKLNEFDEITITSAAPASSLAKNGITAGTAYTMVPDAESNNSDDVISASDAYAKIAEELAKASSIGTDKAATVSNAGNGEFTITKGTVEVKDGLSFNLHVGADADMTNKITVNIDSMSAAGLGIKGLNVSDDTGMAATYAIDAIADALAKVSAQRSDLGAVQNRLEHTIANVDNVVENTTAAESRIRDTDMAEMMVEYSKNNILAQAGQSMLAQANQATQGVLSLLQ